jgi:hypothetical protein
VGFDEGPEHSHPQAANRFRRFGRQPPLHRDSSAPRISVYSSRDPSGTASPSGNPRPGRGSANTSLSSQISQICRTGGRCLGAPADTAIPERHSEDKEVGLGIGVAPNAGAAVNDHSFPGGSAS